MIHSSYGASDLPFSRMFEPLLIDGNLLNKMDTLILTGPAHVGKSEFATQVSGHIAALRGVENIDVLRTRITSEAHPVHQANRIRKTIGAYAEARNNEGCERCHYVKMSDNDRFLVYIIEYNEYQENVLVPTFINCGFPVFFIFLAESLHKDLDWIRRQDRTMHLHLEVPEIDDRGNTTTSCLVVSNGELRYSYPAENPEDEEESDVDDDNSEISAPPTPDYTPPPSSPNDLSTVSSKFESIVAPMDEVQKEKIRRRDVSRMPSIVTFDDEKTEKTKRTETKTIYELVPLKVETQEEKGPPHNWLEDWCDDPWFKI